ncbi:MAG: SMC-Scp complex subunit ScpB [Candidatus Liptonbacteria bacterium]
MDPKLLGKLEALFFIHGEPIRLSDVARTLGLEDKEAINLLAEFKETLKGDGRGLMLLSHGDKHQFVTKPEVSGVLTQFVKRELDSDLTPASLETLAIIAYLGPITKARIEYFRGVNSTVILRNLGLRGLVSRIPDPEKRSIWAYEPSFELFRHFCVSKREDLPEYPNFIARFEARKPEEGPGVSASENTVEDTAAEQVTTEESNEAKI